MHADQLRREHGRMRYFPVLKKVNAEAHAQAPEPRQAETTAAKDTEAARPAVAVSPGLGPVPAIAVLRPPDRSSSPDTSG
jgi:hypothetical protein